MGDDMVLILSFLCVLLVCCILLLGLKIAALHRAADKLRREFSARINEDTNVGIDISIHDRHMRQLTADMDKQIRLLRKEYLRYTHGDMELKNAVTNISHDLRTPLTAICGYMSLLEKEPASPVVKEYLSIIDNRVQALKQLTEELFRYSIFLSVDSYHEREALSINSALEECIAGYYAALIKAGIQPDIRLTEVPVIRTLNKQALMRIFSNVIGNAIKYSAGDLHILLEDDGVMHFMNLAPKLDALSTAKLFDRFYTVESARTQGATGLGLSIARTLAEDMGGCMDASYTDGMLDIMIAFSPDRNDLQE